MNQRNVEALERIIHQGIDHVVRGHKVEPPQWTRGQLRILAEFIAYRALVPSTLTDEDTRNGYAFGVHEEGYDSGTWYELSRDKTVSELERIAKGETE